MVMKIVMPKLSLTMKEGTVGRWYKKEGETVEKGEPIVEIMSEKATYDLEAPTSGILRRIFVEESVDAPVNAVLAVITAPDEDLAEEAMQIEVSQTDQEAEMKVPASPAAKRMAKEYAVDLLHVKGSGPNGRIIEEDVTHFVDESRGLLPKVKEVIPLSGFRKTSAERVSTSFRTAPHSAIVMESDFSEVSVLRVKLQVSYTSIIVKVVAKALKEHPIINSMLRGDEIVIFDDVNIGVAVATENGLVVPVVHAAHEKTLEEIEMTIKDLTEKSRNGKLAKEEVDGGTFTITNLGMYGVDFFMPIINPPEAAILGVGRVTEKPVVVEGETVTRPMIMLSLSYDHRIVDGVPAAKFLRRVKEILENSNLLMA